MNFFWFLPSCVFTVAINLIQIYQEGTVFKGSNVPICIVNIRAWREGQDLVNALSKGQNFRELKSLGIKLTPHQKKRKRGLRRNHAATSGKACNYHETSILRKLSLAHGALWVSALLNVSIKQYVTYNTWEQIKLTGQAAVKLDQSVYCSMARHDRNMELVSQIETSKIISRPVTILHSCFLLVVTEAKQHQTKSVTSSLLGWKCFCGLIVLLEISALEDAGSGGNIFWVNPTTPFGAHYLLWTPKYRHMWKKQWCECFGVSSQ